MANQLSPGIVIREVDLTNLAASAENLSNAGFVGQFVWGPAGKIVVTTSKNNLKTIFGPPTESNYVDWYSAGNFLDYSNQLLLSRVVDESSATPSLNSTVTGYGLLVKNADHYQTLVSAGVGSSEIFVARYPGALGDSLKVSLADSNTFDTWDYNKHFDIAPGTSEFASNLGAENDELHLVVIDEDGKFSGTPGTILESYAFLSKAADAKGLDGKPIFYGNVLNNESNFVWYFGPIKGSGDLDIEGHIGTITVDTAGTGYGNPKVTITDSSENGHGTGATAVAILGTGGDAGTISSIQLVNPGSGYTDGNIDITITDGGEGATAKAIFNSSGVITSVIPLLKGKDYGSATVTIEDQGTGFTGTTTLASTGAVKTANRTADGTGYHENDVITLTGGTGATVKVTGVDQDGKITTSTLLTGGTGYSSGTGVTGTVSPTGGSGAQFTTTVGKALSNVTVTGHGSNYGPNPKVTFAGDGTGAAGTATVVNGTITGITLTNNGSGYTTPPTVSITTGSGASVSAVIGAKGTANEGRIISYLIDTDGQGAPIGGTNYSNPKVVITTTGADATASATVLADDPAATNWGQHCTSNTGTPVTFYSLVAGEQGAYTKSLYGGFDGQKASSSDLINTWSIYKNSEQVDVSLLFVGDAGGDSTSKTVIRYIVDEVVGTRNDCMLFFSPNLSDVLNKEQFDATDNILEFLNDSATGIYRNTSYASCDSGWKLQYDVINDKYRWIPLNADIAGLCARTEKNFAAWFSPAGLERGQIQNVVSLAFNPNKESRDRLYKANVNPVVSFTNEGTVLFGDKTLQTKNSALSFINVRRLLLSLERFVGKVAKQQLFQFNDETTRATFRGIVEPFLRNVKAGRGLYDYKVLCDETNNTPDVIDRAEFVATIFVKPERSINFITLNFVIVRTGVEFSEVVGSV